MAAITTIQDNSFIQTIDIGLQGLLYTKFGDIFKLEDIKKGVVMCPKDIAQRQIAEYRGATEVEFINLWRTSLAPDWKRMHTAAARRGFLMQYVDILTRADIGRIKAVPVKMVYDVWAWTHYRERLNLMAERFLFWQQDDPNLKLNLEVKYDNETAEYPTELDLHFGDIIDESMVVEKFEKGQIYIHRFSVSVDGLVFVADTLKTITKIIFSVYDNDALETDADYEEIIVEDSNQNTELELALRLIVREYT